MKTLILTAQAGSVIGAAGARAAWRRRVARIGSLIQLAFAALWLTRGTLATRWPGQLPIAITLAAGAVAIGAWGALITRDLAPRPRGPAARRLERAITIATAAQLTASCALPVMVSAAGRPDFIVTTVAITSACCCCGCGPGSAPPATWPQASCSLPSTAVSPSPSPATP